MAEPSDPDDPDAVFPRRVDPPAAAEVTLRPLAAADFAGYRAAFIADWAADLARVDALAADAALAEATRRTDASLPAGVATAGHHLYGIWCGAERVGTLWFSLADGRAFLDDITVIPGARGRGHGRRALAQLEVLARSLGADRIDLHVYRDNPRAIALYAQLGYRTTGLQMRKALA